jgi:dienelactone hydrolase
VPQNSYHHGVNATFPKLLISLTMLSSMTYNNADAAEARNDWDASLFAYERPEKLEVEVTTPTGQQVSWVGRPNQLAAKAAVKPTTVGAEVKPRAVGPVDVLHLKFRDADGDVVPALLCTPRGKTGPFPVVVAVHGLTSNKAQVAAQVAPELAERGFAVIAPDMPRHGERPGQPWSILDASNPLKTFELFRQTIRDVRMCIDLAEERPELDTTDGVVLMGYSLGSWINAVAGPADDRVKAMVLMVGGAHDVALDALPIKQLRATDPRTAIAHFAPRPVLMLNAKQDVVVTPEMGKRLFAACDANCTEQRWYDCGHLLSNAAYEDAAEWVAKQLKRAAEQPAAGAKKKAG